MSTSIYEIKSDIQHVLIDNMGMKANKYIEEIDDLDSIEELQAYLKKLYEIFLKSGNKKMMLYISKIIKEL